MPTSSIRNPKTAPKADDRLSRQWQEAPCCTAALHMNMRTWFLRPIWVAAGLKQMVRTHKPPLPDNQRVPFFCAMHKNQRPMWVLCIFLHSSALVTTSSGGGVGNHGCATRQHCGKERGRATWNDAEGGKLYPDGALGYHSRQTCCRRLKECHNPVVWRDAACCKTRNHTPNDRLRYGATCCGKYRRRGQQLP